MMHFIDLELFRIEFLQHRSYVKTKLGSIEDIAISNFQLNTMANLTRIGIWSRRREADRHKANSRNKATIQGLGQLASLHPGCADVQKGSIRSPSDRYVGLFDQTDTRVNNRFFQTAHIRRGIRPFQARGVEPVAPLPSLQGNYGQSGTQLPFAIEVAGS